MSMSATMRSRRSVNERRDYALLFAISFPLFLVVAAISRCVPIQIRPMDIAPGRFLNIIGDARASAHSILPHAFMLR